MTPDQSRTGGRPLPSTAAQRRVWTLERRAHSAAYNVSAELDLPLTLVWSLESRRLRADDREALREALPDARVVEILGDRHHGHLVVPSRVADALSAMGPAL